MDVNVIPNKHEVNIWIWRGKQCRLLECCNQKNLVESDIALIISAVYHINNHAQENMPTFSVEGHHGLLVCADCVRLGIV